MASHKTVWRRTNILSIILGALAAPVSSYDSGQFRTFFPAWSQDLISSRDGVCAAYRDAYYNDQTTNGYHQGIRYSDTLANCLLGNLNEFQKSEAGVVTVLFGLLPTIFTLIGPAPEDISLLALRRPVLAFLLAIPLPSFPMPDGMSTPNRDTLLREPVSLPLRAWAPLKSSTLCKALIAACEYTMAGVAAAHMIYTMYQLAFWTITVSTIAVNSGMLPSTYGPFMWLGINMAVQVISFLTLKLRYQKDQDCGPDYGRDTALNWWLSEITPCIYGEPTWLRRAPDTFLHFILSLLLNAGVLVLLVFVTVILSSQLFISLGDALTVTARILTGGVVCRLILAFELQCMREVTSEATSEATRLRNAEGFSQDESLLVTRSCR
jgi:hypothetical protein